MADDLAQAVERWLEKRQEEKEAWVAQDEANARWEKSRGETAVCVEKLGTFVGRNIDRRIHRMGDGRMVLIQWREGWKEPIVVVFAQDGNPTT